MLILLLKKLLYRVLVELPANYLSFLLKLKSSRHYIYLNSLRGLRPCKVREINTSILL
jgi:hypothetical protein